MSESNKTLREALKLAAEKQVAEFHNYLKLAAMATVARQKSEPAAIAEHVESEAMETEKSA